MPNNKSYKLNTTIMPNNNEKETMTQAFSNNEKDSMAQAFSCEDGLKGLKDPKKCLNQESKKFLLKGLKSSF